MSDQILTDEEKDALLEGVTTGQIEVQSFAGPRYAEVRPFEIPARSRIATNSFPRLERLNQRFAADAGKLAAQMVSAEAEISARLINTCSYGEFSDSNPAFSLVIEFTAKPLVGTALIYLDAALVRQLVESFYGGTDNEPVDHPPDMFTRGETSVASLFCSDLLRTLAVVWKPLVDAEHKQVGVHPSSDIFDGIEISDAVICAEFGITFAGHEFVLHIVWPMSMVTSLLPVFEGQKRERDAAKDALWEKAIRSRVTESVVGISSRVGHSRMTLGAVAELEPGDIIDLEDPRKSTVFVKHVPILEGVFGVHHGRYAIEAKQWLCPAVETGAR